MKSLSFANLSIQLFLLIFLVFLPILGLEIYSFTEHRKLAGTCAGHQALELVRRAAGCQEELINDTHILLAATSQLPEVYGIDTDECNKLFMKLMEQNPQYTIMGLVGRDGTLLCTVPAGGPVNLADSAFFQLTMKKRDFAIGDYQVGRITGKASLHFGYPVFDRAGQIVAVLAAAVDLSWLDRLIAKMDLPPGSTMAVVDRNGIILARRPDPEKWVGQFLPEAHFAWDIVNGQDEGTAGGRGLDGERRLYAFRRLQGGEKGLDACLYAGIPEKFIFASVNRSLARNLTGTLLVTLLALGVALAGSNMLFLRKVNRLLDATRRLAAGDLASRTGMTSSGELDRLGIAFDKMARALQQRTIELQLAEIKVKQRLAVEEVIARASRLFISPEGPCPNEVLKVLGLAVSANRAYVFEFRADGRKMDNTYEWCDPATEPRIDNLCDLDTGLFPWWIDKLKRGENILIPDAAALPGAVAAEIEILRAQGIHSLLAAPIHSTTGLLTGFMGFDDTEKCREWTAEDIQILRVVAEMVGICREHRQAREALRQSEVYFRSLIENALDLIVILDREGTISYVSPSVQRVLGYKPECLIGWKSFELVHEEDRLKVIESFKETIENIYYTQNKEFRFRHRDGAWRTLEAVGKNLLDDPAVAGIVANLRDITERKRVEEALRTAHRQLRDIIEFLPDAIFVIDRDKKVIAWNREMERMTGVKKEAIIGKTEFAYSTAFYEKKESMLIDFISLDAEKEEINYKNYSKVEKRGNTIYAEGFVPSVFKGRGGFLWGMATPLYDEGGDVAGAIEIIRDVTDFKKAEAELIEANTKANRAERMALLGAMAAGIAHKINQPLNSLKIITEGMLYLHKKGRTFTFSEITEELQEISVQVGRIDRTIKRVRSLIKREDSKELSLCDLNSAAERSLNALEHELSSNRIIIKKSLYGSLPLIRASGYRIEEVINNLVVNSIQALEKINSEVKEICISTLLDERGRVIFEISDNGTGLKDKIIDKIFDPFFTTKEPGEGMGLGLAIVYSIVTFYNGQIHVRTNEKGGAVFRLEFPADKLL